MVIPSKVDVMIVGAGVSGLTTGICLAEAGLRVGLLAERLPQTTTSAVAGASWGPYLASDPRVLAWSMRTRAVFEALPEPADVTGVRFVDGMEASAELIDPPDWLTMMPAFRPESMPPEGFARAWRYVNPLVDMPRYLGYLEERLRAAGGWLLQRRVTRFADIADLAPLVVNCSGLGARQLAGDRNLTPTRGQLVVVKNPGVDWFFQDQAETGELTYFLPHKEVVVLGGSALPGGEDHNIDLAIAARIIERCGNIEPKLRTPVVVAHRVGLRPSRPRVCLERDRASDTPLIHNYGHGGSGVTLSWGCAEEVRDLVRMYFGSVPE